MTATTSVRLPAYAEALRKPARYKVLWGGRAAGRSWSVARQLLLDAQERRLRILCAREWQRSLKDSVHRLLSDQIDTLMLPGFTVTDTEIRHQNGSLFLFEGLRTNATKIKSLEGIDRCWVEEAERVSERSWEVLLPTIRVHGSEVWVTFNPYLETDPTYQRFIVHPPDDAVVVHSTYRDNPWLSDEIRAEIAHLRKTDPDAAAHVYDGVCLSRSDAQVLAGKWVVESFEPGGEGWEGPFYGADWGFANDPTVLVRCWIHERSLYCEHAVYANGASIDQTPALFCKVPEAREHMIRADGSWPQTVEAVKKLGFIISAAPKWAGSVEDGIAHLRQYERIVIHERCQKLAEEARLWRYKTDELTGEVLPKLVPGHDHGWDAMRYALAPKIQHETGLVYG